MCCSRDTLWCSVVQCGALCCSVLYNMLHNVLRSCGSVVQCVAVCCSVLQCVAVWCSVVQCDAQYVAQHNAQCIAVVLQCGAVCGTVWCYMLQCVA